MTQPLTKYCARGKHTLPREQFAKNRSSRDGLQHQCRACQSDRYQGKYPWSPINQLKQQLGISLKVRAAGVRTDVADYDKDLLAKTLTGNDAVRPHDGREVSGIPSTSAASRRACV